MVAALVRTVLGQPDTDAARRQFCEITTHLERSLANAAAVLADAEDEVTA
jgi:hypothetical protein